MIGDGLRGRLWSLLAVLVLLSLWAGGECWCFATTLAQLNSASAVDFSYDNMTVLAVDNGAQQVNFWRLDTK